MEYYFDNLSNEDRKPVIDIFNHYVENSFAAFFETKVSYDFFDWLMSISEGYPRVAIKLGAGEVAGFAILRSYSPIPAFRLVAEISYFIKPQYTRHGMGKAVLDHMVEEAGKLGVVTILASISSLNEPSINFHLNNGFIQCGNFRKIGRKFGRDFDVVWMQRVL